MNDSVEAKTAAPEAGKPRRMKYRDYRRLVESKTVRTLRIINFWFFLLLWAALIAALVLGGAKFMDYCAESFELYENSQLSRTLDATLARLNSADAPALTQLLTSEIPESGAFDDGQEKMLEKYELLVSAELTAKETRNPDNANHRYNLYADGAPVGTFEITSVGQTSRLGLLKMEDWQYAGGSVSFGYDRFDRSYTVPQGFVISLNGIPLTEEYQVGEPVPIDTYRYVEEYLAMPRMVTYQVQDLLAVPETVILDNNGNPVEIDPEAPSVVLPDTWNPTDMPEDTFEWVMNTAKVWTEYALFDRYIREVRAFLIPDSQLWIQVGKTEADRIYRTAHTLTGYENETITEYTVYSDDCFSCRVSMLRHIFVDRNKKDMPDTVDDVMFFYRTDLTDDGVDNPIWYLVDAFSVME